MEASATRAMSRTRITNRHVVWAGALVLLLPNVLFALHLRPVPAAIMLIGAIGYATLLRKSEAPTKGGVLSQALDIRRFGLCLLLSSVLLVLGGEGHLVYANWDWLSRDAVLADLAKTTFPPSYQIGEQTLFLRAPLGMYMLPAMVAEATSLGLGHAALLAQNSVLLTFALYMLATLAGRRAILVVAVFIAFSGLDALGEILIWLKQGRNLASFVLPSHIETWIGLQYSSVLTQMFWVPNHALPAYWLTILVLLCVREEIGVAELGLVLAACLFWSPFAFIGTLPFALYLLFRNLRATVISRRAWLAAAVALCFLPVALYMQIDAAKVPHEFILFHSMMAFNIALFLAFEISHVMVCRYVWNGYDANLKALLIVAVMVLVTLPTIRVGLADDLVMRASIPALMILSYAFAQALAIAAKERRWGLLAAGGALALVAAITPLQEVRRSLAFSRFAISDCNLLTVWKKVWPGDPGTENYLAHRSPVADWLMAVGDAAPLSAESKRVCWPDYPYNLRSSITRMSNSMLAKEHKDPPL